MGTEDAAVAADDAAMAADDHLRGACAEHVKTVTTKSADEHRKFGQYPEVSLPRLPYGRS